MHLYFILDEIEFDSLFDKTNLQIGWNVQCSDISILDEAKLAEVNKEIEILKSQTEKDMDDKEKLMRQVLEKNKECKTLNNRLQEAKVKSLIYPKRLFHKSYKKQT